MHLADPMGKRKAPSASSSKATGSAGISETTAAAGTCEEANAVTEQEDFPVSCFRPFSFSAVRRGELR